MSDSDDTDVLLLVPPDAFVINSPPCVSPIDQERAVNYQNDIIARPIESFVNIMENGYTNSSPSKYRPYQSIFSTNRNNEFSPFTFSELTAEKTSNNKIGTWPPRNDDFLQNTFDKHKTKTSDMVTRETSKCEQITNRVNEKFSNAEEERGQSPKFSLRQVDKLLSEMEKTRAEIKSKLQTNKNKIHEMRREYTSTNNADASFNNNRDVISSTQHEIFGASKQGNNEHNATKKPLNTTMDVLTPRCVF